MGLSTVMNTALSGMTAATTIIDVTANNLANSQTAGFKAGRVRLATLPVQTLSLGGGLGANPSQLGTGVQVIGVDKDFSQGPIEISDQPALLALDGEGLFILESAGGGRLYTRDGQFRLNSAGELVTTEGDRVLGFAVGADGELDHSQLRPITIRLGSTAASPLTTTATLRSYSIGRSGKVVGHYSDGSLRTLGQLRLARFANPAGLAARPGNKFAATAASGLPIETDPTEAGAAAIFSGATEQSNVDMGRELIELTLAGNLFQANWAVFQTADNMLGAMFFPWRR
jgi:flagellar hook protein FlgE